MPHSNSYYPVRIGDQIIWLRNYRNKLPNHQAPLGYTDDEIAAIQADCDRLIWLLETFQEAAQSFAQAVTSHIQTLQNGPGNDLIAPPVFSLPATPVPPANVLPGALKRLTTGIRNLKTRPGYLDSLGQDLGVVAPAQPAPDPQTTRPVLKLVLGAGGHVEAQLKKQGFPGARLEVDRGNGQWVLLAIITAPHYVDTLTPAPGSPPSGNTAPSIFKATNMRARFQASRKRRMACLRGLCRRASPS